MKFTVIEQTTVASIDLGTIADLYIRDGFQHLQTREKTEVLANYHSWKARLMATVITYIVVGLPYSIFQIPVHFFSQFPFI